MELENKEKNERYRNWSWIVYPESAPENWRTLLDETGEKWIESPLHDRDINETTNEIKKLIGILLFRLEIKRVISKQKKISELLTHLIQ